MSNQAKKVGLRLLPFVLFIGLGLLFWKGLSLNPHLLPSVRLGQVVPQFELPLLGDEGMLTNQTLKGRVLLLNVWASWCTSCAEEQAFLLQLSRKGIPIIGLNFQDSPQQALTWLKRWGNPYQVIGSDADGKLAIDLGVYGTPETFVIGRDGQILHRYVGILTKSVWKKELERYFHA